MILYIDVVSILSMLAFLVTFQQLYDKSNFSLIVVPVKTEHALFAKALKSGFGMD